MKKFIAKFSLVSLLGLCVLMTACDKNEDVVPVIDNTIAGQILKDTNYSLFESLVGKANLAMLLGEPGPFTVFTPDDEAFAASGITLSTINNLTQAQAQTIVLYHTLNKKTLAAELPAGPQDTVITFSGDSLFVTKEAGITTINGIKIIQADIAADNGVMHKVEKVLMPSGGSIIETATKYSLDSLVKAINRATNDSTGDAALKDILNTSTLTLFAPTDSAFINLLSDLSLTDINEISVDSLVATLKYHLAPGRIFSNELSNGPLTMLSGGTTTIGLTNSVTGGPAITGANNGGNASNMIATNLLYSNGALYVIDRVLLP